MSQNQHLDYYEVLEVLDAASSPLQAAECHGLLSGLICAAGFADPRVWVPELFEAYNPQSSSEERAYKLTQVLYETAITAFNSTELEFELLLPDDEQTLVERTEALGAWCQGFLAGLGLGGMPDEHRLSPEVKELLEDLSQVAKVGFEGEEFNEDDSVAFEEVTEYVRVGVIFMFEELQPAKAAPSQVQ